MNIISFINEKGYKLLNIANYNDVDYYVINFEDNYKFFYEENNEIKEFILFLYVKLTNYIQIYII